MKKSTSFNVEYCWIRSVALISHLIENARKFCRMKCDWLQWHTHTHKSVENSRQSEQWHTGGVFNAHTRPYSIRPCARRSRKQCILHIHASTARNSVAHSHTFAARQRKNIRFSIQFLPLRSYHWVARAPCGLFYLFIVHLEPSSSGRSFIAVSFGRNVYI